MIIPRTIYKTVEWAFYNHEALKKAVTAHEENIMEDLQKPRIPAATGGGVGHHSDSTALAAISLVEGGSRDIRRYRKWCVILDAVKGHFAGTSYGTLIDLYYGQGIRDTDVICEKLFIERATFYNMKNEIVATSWRVGIEKGILKAFAS